MDKVYRMCDICESHAVHRIKFSLDNKPEREIDMCPPCHEKFCEQVEEHSRRSSPKRRHRAYRTRTYEDKPA